MSDHRESGHRHDDHHRDMDYDNHDHDYWGDNGPNRWGPPPPYWGPPPPPSFIHPEDLAALMTGSHAPTS